MLVVCASGCALAWPARSLATPTAHGEAAPPPSGAPSCFPAAPTAGPGEVEPFRPPRPEATRLNVEGKLEYRKQRWEVARTRYRAAEAADPDFLAPALNVACSFVRQERFDDATAEVLRIVDRAYVPWRAEIEAAADLGALKVRPAWASIAAAFDHARLRWAAGLPEDVLFIARTHQALGLGATSSGVFVLGPRQEIFAWTAHTLRTRQLTTEQGRVIAMLPSRDRQRVAYVIAEKLIREGGRATALRGVEVVVLDLRMLTAETRRPIAGDVGSLVISQTRAGFSLRVEDREGKPVAAAQGAIEGGGANPLGTGPPGRGARSIEVRATGVVASAAVVEIAGGCSLRARDVVAGGLSQVDVRAAGSGRAPGRQGPRPGSRPTDAHSWRVGSPHGASLFGLPLD